MNRKHVMDELRVRGQVDVLVVGGGINGVSVFRELALQGVNVLLVERHDFCSGASAAPSRMVHGGLRYLENGEFKLVKESLFERDRLLANAPHYVGPLPTTVPIFDFFSGIGNGIVRFLGLTRRPSRRGAVVIKAGLSIYDFFTKARRMMPQHQFRSRRETLAKWPALNPSIRNSATYYDAWVSHPERIGIELLEDGLSAHAGAHALNYAEAQRGADGGLVVQDRISGEEVSVTPRMIVNATGGWIDLTNGALEVQSERPLMGGTKGSHLIVDNDALKAALGDHMIYYENEDGRICILFPYLGKVLIGSTDIRVDNPEVVRCEPDERDYILQSLAFVLPEIRIRPEEIVFQFAGVRPLPASNDSFTGRIPRDHFCTVIEGEQPVLCMIGGKWTTFRSFGELAADMVLERLALPRRVETTERAIGGGRDYPANRNDWVARLAERHRLTLAQAELLFRRYGTKAAAIAAFIAEGNDAPLPDADYSRREILHLIRNEAVEHLGDIILRRTTLAITGEITMRLADAILDLLATERQWPDERRAAERALFLDLMAERHGVSAKTLIARNSQGD